MITEKKFLVVFNVVKWKYSLQTMHTVPQSTEDNINSLCIDTFNMIDMMTICTFNKYTMWLHFSEAGIARFVIILHHIPEKFW